MTDAAKTMTAKGPDIEEKNIFTLQLQEKIKDIVRLMVDDPNDIRVSFNQGEKTTVFVVSCGKHNIGKILGKGGKNISALRTVVQAISSNFGFRAVIEIPYYP